MVLEIEIRFDDISLNFTLHFKTQTNEVSFCCPGCKIWVRIFISDEVRLFNIRLGVVPMPIT